MTSLGIGSKTFLIRIIAASIALIILAASVYVLISRQRQQLWLININTGETLHRAKAPDGTEFSITYIHSVNRSPVTEYYQIVDGQIYLRALRYASFGAGMPTELADGQILEHDDGDMLITGYDRHIPDLCYYISRVDGHTFEIGGAAILLRTLDEPGAPISFVVKKGG